MHDTYSYPLVWLLLLILVEKWFSNVIAHYDVFVAVILKAEKKNKMYQVQHKSIHCSSQSPDSSTKYERIRKRKGYLFMTNKKNNCISRLTEIIRKPWLIKNLFFIARKFFLKRHLFVFFQSTAWVITR